MTLKLLDYGRSNPFGKTLGKTRNLAWPVNVYRVTLPTPSMNNDSLNAFEQVILKLLDAGSLINANSLARETCIPIDLIKGVLLRLQDKGFIDENGRIISQEDSDNRKTHLENDKFVTALIFRELVTGKILPYLHLLNDENPLLKKEENEKKFRQIPKINTTETPKSRDVINAIRTMKKRSDAFGEFNKMPAVALITVAEQPEFYYLDCPIAIQQSDGEFRIADPFDIGFSLALERAFEQLLEKDENLEKWLKNWKQSLSNNGYEKQEVRTKEAFENDENLKRYPELIDNLRPTKNTSFRSISQIHASLEWALFYACIYRSFESVISELKFTSSSEHTERLERASKSIGLETKLDYFRGIKDGKLLNFKEGKAELETLLAIAILQAEQDFSHPMRQIAISHLNALTRFSEIKKKRDKEKHGATNKTLSDFELSDDKFMREIIHLLLPNVKFSDTPNIASMNKDVRADILFDARAIIQNEFGFKVFNQFGVNLQNNLIHAESFWICCKDGDDALIFVSDIYAIMQSVFEHWFAGKLSPEIKDTDFIIEVENKLKNAGGYKTLPECLRTVKPTTIRQSLQGSSSTLGACVIAFLLLVDDEILTLILNNHPSFIDNLEEIIIKRGHGNTPIKMPKSEIQNLRKTSYITLKTLIEA